MKFYQRRSVALVVLVLAIVFSCVYGISKRPAQLPEVKYYNWIADEAKLLSPATEDLISSYNTAWNDKYYAVVAVAAVDNIRGWKQEDFVYELGERWGLGANDMLLLIVEDDHYYVGLGDNLLTMTDTQESKLRAALFVKDPEAVAQAFALGVGRTGTFSIGAKFTPGMPGPFVAEGTVCSLHDGYFRLEGPAKRGTLACIGKSAVVRFGNIDILLCHTGAASGDPQLFRHFGIEQSLYDLVVVKANTSFRLPYSKISDLIYCADTVGAGASNLQLLPFKRLPQGLYPFDTATNFTPNAQVTAQ